jgi:hypothetical protein
VVFHFRRYIDISFLSPASSLPTPPSPHWFTYGLQHKLVSYQTFPFTLLPMCFFHSPCPQLHSRPDQRFGTPSILSGPINLLRELTTSCSACSIRPLAVPCAKATPYVFFQHLYSTYIKVCPQISLDRSLDGVVIRVLFSIRREKERERRGDLR